MVRRREPSASVAAAPWTVARALHSLGSDTDALIDSVIDDGASDPLHPTLSHEIARWLTQGLTQLPPRERVRQTQQGALLKLKRGMQRQGLDRDACSE